jgi:hypothetical protein
LRENHKSVNPYLTLANAWMAQMGSNSNVTYLTAAQVRQRFGGISDMALWRWLHDEDLKFPQPLYIQRRRFWRASDLTAWEAPNSSRTRR